MDKDMESRIRIRIGQSDIEYEGPASYLNEGLLSLLKDVIPLYEAVTPAYVEEGRADTATTASDESQGAPTIDYSVTTMAAKLGGASGRDLALAAAAYLSFVEGRESFTRQELLKAMQQAPSYYKQTMGSNLTKTISRMIRSDDLLEGAKGSYSIGALRKGQLKHELGL